MITIFMMPGRIATLGLYKMKVFWSKGYDAINSIHDVTNKIFLGDSSYIVDVVK